MWICLHILILGFGLEFAKGGEKTVHDVLKDYNKYIEDIENKNVEQDEMIKKQELKLTSLLQDQLKEFRKTYDEIILRLEKKNEENEKTIIELKKQLKESKSDKNFDTKLLFIEENVNALFDWCPIKLRPFDFLPAHVSMIEILSFNIRTFELMQQLTQI